MVFHVSLSATDNNGKNDTFAAWLYFQAMSNFKAQGREMSESEKTW